MLDVQLPKSTNAMHPMIPIYLYLYNIDPWNGDCNKIHLLQLHMHIFCF